MMAHYAKTVVVVQDTTSGSPFRGYSHQKLVNGCRETVYLPFNTEYSFKFKFRDGVRRRVRITIDGTEVVKSLIVQDGAVLERFQDVDRRFKFVTLDHPEVQDPTSPDNGNVKIEMWAEKPAPPVLQAAWTSSPTYRSKGMGSGVIGSGVMRSMSLSTDSLLSADCCDMMDRGATVEGAVSTQTFGATSWRGDGDHEVFVFDLRSSRVETPVPTPRTHPSDYLLLGLAKTPKATMIYIRPSFHAQLAHLSGEVYVRNTDRETLELNLMGWINGIPVHQSKALGPDWKIV